MNIDLKLERVRQGYTQSQLAEKADISLITYRRAENCLGDPKTSTMVKIAKALNVSVESIIKKED